MIITIIVTLIIFLILLKLGMGIKIKDIKEIKKVGYDKNLNAITDKLPKNTEVCEQILAILNNNNTKIEENKNEKETTSLYLVMQNKIIIANINSTFTRIQTIAHECIHSVQNRISLKFNFIFSNINILFFLVLCSLTIFKVINNNEMFLESILLYMLISLIQFAVRNYLETDAMIRAKYLAQEYIEKTGILSEEEENLIISKYSEINNIGIKFYSFMLITQFILKMIILCIIYLLIN